MTDTLISALKALNTIRTGFVIRNLDGTAKTHILRHGYGTHAAMFGVNPWKVMLWMGHKRIGPPGSGKSSLVIAGVLVRLVREVAGVGSFVVRDQRPGERPAQRLGQALGPRAAVGRATR
jgi:hypothetical protein